MSDLAKNACKRLLFCPFPCDEKMLQVCLDGIKEVAGTAETATFYIGLTHFLYSSVWGTIKQAKDQGASVGVDLTGLRKECLYWLVHNVARMGANPIVLDHSFFRDDEEEMLKYIKQVKKDAESSDIPCPEVWLSAKEEDTPADLFDFAKANFQGFVVDSNKFDTVKAFKRDKLSVIVSGFDGESPNKFLEMGADKAIIGGFHRDDCAGRDIMRRIHGVASLIL